MVAMVIYDKNDRELAQLRQISKDVFAIISEEELQLNCISEELEAVQGVEQGCLLDLACVKISREEDIQLLRLMRKAYSQIDISIIADQRISPMKYMTPDIRAASLLLAPYKQQDCKQVMREFLDSFFQTREKVDEKKVFVINNRDGKITIPYHQVYYIEIRERKVFVRLKDKEYSLYDSLEHVMERLPNIFLRCHRSFVFNTQQLDTVKLSENTVYLKNGITVPLSRSFKPIVKEYIHELGKS